MKQKICTSIEQSKKLVELGLNPKSADCCWRILPGTKEGMPNQYIALALDEVHFETDIPCWSLSALLDLMPQHIDTRLGWQKFGIDKGWDGGIYQVFYENKNSYIQMKEKTAIDAVIEMIVYLFEKGYLKK